MIKTFDGISVENLLRRSAERNFLFISKAFRVWKKYWIRWKVNSAINHFLSRTVCIFFFWLYYSGATQKGPCIDLWRCRKNRSPIVLCYTNLLFPVKRWKRVRAASIDTVNGCSLFKKKVYCQLLPTW